MGLLHHHHYRRFTIYQVGMLALCQSLPPTHYSQVKLLLVLFTIMTDTPSKSVLLYSLGPFLILGARENIEVHGLIPSTAYGLLSTARSDHS